MYGSETCASSLDELHPPTIVHENIKNDWTSVWSDIKGEKEYSKAQAFGEMGDMDCLKASNLVSTCREIEVEQLERMCGGGDEKVSTQRSSHVLFRRWWRRIAWLEGAPMLGTV